RRRRDEGRRQRQNRRQAGRRRAPVRADRGISAIAAGNRQHPSPPTKNSARGLSGSVVNSSLILFTISCRPSTRQAPAPDRRELTGKLPIPGRENDRARVPETAMAPVAPSFLRSTVGRGFIIFALLCGVMSVGVGVASYYSTLDWFQVNKGEEKITAVQLVDAFVSAYTKMRTQYLKQEAPVPATFRAQAIARFNEARDKANTLRLIWVGPTGREIATAPTDKEMAATIDSFTREAKPKPVTRFVTVHDALLFRTVYPSIASQQSCVTCHNQVQAGKPNKPEWHLNDVMGASVLDVPAGPFLHKALHDAVLTSLAVFLFSMAIGLITFYLQYREFARRAASEA